MRQRTGLAWNYRTLQWGRDFSGSQNGQPESFKLDWSSFKLSNIFQEGKDTFWSGLKRGRSLVPSLHDLWGIKSQTSSGTWSGRSTSRSLVDCPDQCSTYDKDERRRREICYLIKYLYQRANNMIVALLKPLLENTAGTAEFQRMSFAPVKETHDQFQINVIEFITQSWSAVWDLSYLVSPIGVPVTGSCWYLGQKSLS